MVKRAGAVVYRLLALSPDGIIFPIRCKLALDAAATRAIRATAVQFNAAASYCAAVAWRERVTNKNKLHHIVYGPTRSEYELGHNSGLFCQGQGSRSGEGSTSERLGHMPDIRLGQQHPPGCSHLPAPQSRPGEPVHLW